MMKFLATVLIVLGTLIALAAYFVTPADAQSCNQRSEAVEHLFENYQEQPISNGISSSGHLVEIFVGPSGGFTILATTPQGLACVLATGENWRDVSFENKVSGQPT